MKFEEALKLMREGHKCKYDEEPYWIDDEGILVKTPYDWIEGYLEEDIIEIACLYGMDITSDDWELIE